MTEKIFVFESILGNLMKDYIVEKRSVGYKFQKGASMLKRFDTLITQKGLNEKKLTKELILLWTEKSPNETNATRCGRISITRGFAQYMVRLGYQAYIYPISTITINRYSYIPYIFSENEISNIFNVCDNYQISDCSPNRHLVLPLLFRMLYGCGLRISEALNLTYEDVDLERGTLFIKNTKFDKERIVPMASSLTERCRVYREDLNLNKGSNIFLFPSPYGGHYTHSTIYKLFRVILWESGISHTGKGPRVHDLRHAFSVHCLKKWVLKGEDLTNLLPYLSTFLGHADLRGTQHYLRLTADLYPDIITKVEQSFSSLIPEVTSYEAD
ncbi:tyrosine-type recombinase/integrase [Clostridium tagluense]|uniref:tyrosine-type recombinase/integrase n=1 Tax=Clostridium tagluense TaxID=360422 RepID=UPI001C6E603C|nr:tyrosine-type recombinase/integrase [Clostridium tagluense]MBW9154961.1 tyrosine-type recombinase/integrase [Clostridium tagluense]WLC64414.1 tyrosine-type recombinase/integrase [Clostridium tagluense]